MIDEVVGKIKEDIKDEIDFSNEISDEELLRKIDLKINSESAAANVSAIDKVEIRKEIFNSFRKLDVLQDLIDDEGITEIMVNGAGNIFYERNGVISKWGKSFSSQLKLEDVIQQIVAKVNRVVNTSSPIVDARLLDGSRVNIVLPPIAPDGPIITIRRFPKEPMTMERLIQYESISEEAVEFLREAVRRGKNIFISGGTGSGKTTFLNALSNFIPEGERVITIEDSLELQLPIKNIVRLEARNANAEGEGEISIRDLIRTALRMRPDRLIVGEVRGAEALDMLQAMNTGHDGSLSTGHGNSPRDMLSRLETMVLMGGELPLYAIRGQIGAAIDLMIHLGRFPGGSRKVVSIVEVLGYEDGEIGIKEIFKREDDELKKVAEFTGKKR